VDLKTAYELEDLWQSFRKNGNNAVAGPKAYQALCLGFSKGRAKIEDELYSFSFDEMQSLVYDFGCALLPVGSRTISPEAYTNKSDYDYLIYTAHAEIQTKLGQMGFELDGEGHYEPSQNNPTSTSKFNSWRRGKMNLIVTYDKPFFDLFRKANSRCVRQKIIRREDRVRVFQEILYGR